MLRPGAPRSGFTLLESVVTLVILGLLASFALQSLHIAGERESLAAERLVADIRYAQSWAMMSRNKTWAVFDAAANRYTLYAENPASPGRADRVIMVDPLALASFQVTLGDDEMAGVALSSPSFGGQVEVEFDRNGLAYDGFDAPLASDGSVRVGDRTVTVSPAGWVGVS